MKNPNHLNTFDDAFPDAIQSGRDGMDGSYYYYYTLGTYTSGRFPTRGKAEAAFLRRVRLALKNIGREED